MLGEGRDEPAFADGKVIKFGQVIGLVLATTKSVAQRAAKAVNVKYEDIHPTIVTIEVLHTCTIFLFIISSINP